MYVLSSSKDNIDKLVVRDDNRDIEVTVKRRITFMAEIKVYHEINDEIKIDFELPEMLRKLIAEAEAADERNDGSYDNLADTIDTLCKNFYADRKLTLKQWEIIVRRYPQ